jgi:hypothetical protein
VLMTCADERRDRQASKRASTAFLLFPDDG